MNTPSRNHDPHRHGPAEQPTNRPERPLRTPLSAGQERLWLLDRLNPGDAAFNMFQVHRLRGPLHADALERALAELVARHDSLRAAFPDEDGVPAQVIGPSGDFVLERVVVDGVPGEREWHARELVAERTNRPFDVARGPLVRASLLRLDEHGHDHVLCLVLHHIVADGWSMNVLDGELAAVYAAFTAGRPSPLEPLPLSYVDYVRRQRELVDSPEFDERLTYWTRQLTGAPPLDLPADRPRVGGAHAGRGGTVTHHLSADLRTGIEQLARRERVTLYMTLLAAYQTLLARYCDQEDVCVGSPLAGRDEEEYEGLVGYFLNTLVLRGSTAGDPSFRAFLARTRTVTIQAFEHQDVPFERLLGALHVDRDPDDPPVFRTMLTLRPPAGPGLRLGEVTAEVFESGFRQAKFDLALEVWPEGDELVVEFVYDTERFVPETVARLARCFETLLRGAVAEPDTPLSRLPLLPPAERARVSAAAAGPPPGDCPDPILAFEVQVLRTPRADAVECGDSRIGYADLDARANRLARELRRGGTGPDSVIAVCAERSIETIVALLAVLKAGGAYLSVDPALPAERIAYMLADSAAERVLCRAEFAHRFADVAPPVLLLDGDGDGDGGVEGDEAQEQPLASVAGPEHLAYLVYTSGSTGRPKGTLITREALAARVAWMRERYRTAPTDRVLQFASFGFDTHVEEVYPTLLDGATLVLAPADGLLPDFFATDAGRTLTVLDLPTSYWHELVAQTPGLPWPKALRLLIIGGDQADVASTRRWREVFGERVDLVNTYGPTETAVIATSATLAGPRAELWDGTRPPIGRPLAGTRVHVLDRHLEPVPPGVPGELCIGGIGPARGYLGHPGLTGVHFVPDPYGPPGSRLYRTGDRARQRPDGQLEFLGRTDHQVKLRGYRIEPGEIEAALVAQPDIAQAAVLVREEQGDRRLVAYLVPGAEAAEPPEPTAVRAALARALPAYLLPAAFVVLERLPLTANGKLDRAALPAPEQRTTPAASFVAPRGSAEELVAETFADVLGLERVGALDDFFALGGHSLLATRVVARIGTAIELTVPIRALFTDPTVAGLAASIEELLLAELDTLSEADAERLVLEQAETGDPR
ncbi:non-ribosomal peptide synthetase [Embleya scabrispora]|uniref:non-ribosomal peptide synthetase n=1 Tax=Embleya scabrispora TaxID=159449 RepID=UPI00037EFE71|nr:non-ribosomal peptide synthetase [Embleya scabrispora]MYS82706.1 non-ribosomal peptide synthetase [Streptomyces sp. SID5474]